MIEYDNPFKILSGQQADIPVPKSEAGEENAQKRLPLAVLILGGLLIAAAIMYGQYVKGRESKYDYSKDSIPENQR